MFGFLAVLFLYSLLFFGAVRPLETYVVGITAVVGFGVLIVTDVIRRQRLSVFFLLFSGIAFLIMATAGVKPAIGLFAASWSWEAARRKPTSVLKFFYFLFSWGCSRRYWDFSSILFFRDGCPDITILSVSPPER